MLPSLRHFTLATLCVFPLLAQVPDPALPAAAEQPASSAEPAPEPAPPAQVPEDTHIFGVLPNNRTTENSLPFHPITAREKLTMAYKDSFDAPVYLTSGLFAGLSHLENQNPSLGDGLSGYALRGVTAYADQTLGNMMTEGVFPAVFHQDPRYFRLGEGSKAHRAWYAATQIVVARMDSGRSTFNFSEWGGNAAATALSNFYYPDSRTVSANVSKLLIQCATDTFSNVLKEFWPDVKNWMHNKKTPSEASSSLFSSR
jgi:hypothetical protein